jgi:hypothetical protein
MCKVGKSAAQTVKDLQTVYGDYALQKKLVCVSGTAISKVGKNSLKMSFVLGDHEL